MDQSASVFAERGASLFVSFSPSLSVRPVFFPKTKPEVVFLVAQSFVTSNKQVTGPIHYNLRVVECSMAAAVLNAVRCPGTALPADAGPLGASLRGFHANYFKDTLKPMPEQLEELVRVTEATLTRTEGYTLEEVAVAANTTVQDIRTRYMSSFPVRGERFKLRQRALHVFTEALRVLQFLALLADETEKQRALGPTPGGVDEIGDTSAFNQKLGDLMNETQESCRDLYECSCGQIDELCAMARQAGSYGSRLTGAGWGGCSVHLVPADRVETIMKSLADGYYAKRPDLSARDMDGAMVVSRPMHGSAVFRFDDQAW
jgi:galactokinase